MLRHSQWGKWVVWHALLNPAPLLAFDCETSNDTQAHTEMRHEEATGGEKKELEA